MLLRRARELESKHGNLLLLLQLSRGGGSGERKEGCGEGKKKKRVVVEEEEEATGGEDEAAAAAAATTSSLQQQQQDCEQMFKWSKEKEDELEVSKALYAKEAERRFGLQAQLGRMRAAADAAEAMQSTTSLPACLYVSGGKDRGWEG